MPLRFRAALPLGAWLALRCVLARAPLARRLAFCGNGTRGLSRALRAPRTTIAFTIPATIAATFAALATSTARRAFLASATAAATTPA